MTSPQRLIAATIMAICATAACAQTIRVANHGACLDHANRRVLVAISADADPTLLPTTLNIEGTDYDINTTTLPIVSLTHNDEANPDTFVPAHCSIVTPEGKLDEYDATVRYRGATALTYDKKSYALKLNDADGQPLDAPLLGMRADNSWILDAMACDLARMRNRVSTDLWLDFSTPPHYAATEAPDMRNGTRGQFVELFLNDQYWGLYCLTEKIDRKQLQLKKYKDGKTRGILYKSYRYNNLMTLTDEQPSPQSFTWNNFECSYPDVRKGEPITWEPLLDAIRFFTQPTPSTDIRDNLHKYADLPLWIDYNLFCDLLHADDNVCKNMFIYKRDINDDTPFCVCPWDLDATWGRTFDHQPISPQHDLAVVNAVNVLCYISTDEQGAQCNRRWDELRHDTFTFDNIWPYFERYFTLFRTSGAAARETERWQDTNGLHLDFDAEERYIRDWIPQRIAFLDDNVYQYLGEGITPTHTTIDTHALYTLDGRSISTSGRHATRPDQSLHPGIYISNHRKLIVR